MWQARRDRQIRGPGWSCLECKNDPELLRRRGECGGPFLPEVPGGVTPRLLCASGEHSGATWVPLHKIIENGRPCPPPLREGLWEPVSKVLQGAALKRACRDEVMVPFYTCPLAVDGISAECPSPQPADALHTAVESLGYAKAGLPWGPPREDTTDAVRAMALAIDAAQSAAQAFKSRAKAGIEDGW